MTPHEVELATAAAGVDLSSVSPTKHSAVRGHIAEELDLPSEQVGVIGIGETDSVRNRLVSPGLFRRPPVALTVVLVRPEHLDKVRSDLKNIAPLVRHLTTTALLVGDGEDWRIREVIDVSERGIGPAVIAHYPAARLTIIDDDGNEVTTPEDVATGWIVSHSGGSSHDDIEGVRYSFTETVPNWKQVQPGDVAVCFRTKGAGTPDAGCIFGLGRVGRRRQRPADSRHDAYFDRYLQLDDPISLADFGDPRPPNGNAIAKAPAIWLRQLLDRVGLQSLADAPVPISALSVEGIAVELDRRRLFLPPEIPRRIVSAIRGGKHVMLTGPPGTGKTTLGEAVAAAAERVALCAGGTLVTATADWTSNETVGTYRLRHDQELEFRSGQVLEAIDEDRWLVIDELNRSDIDKAIGQLFTVLSGQAVVLPFLQATDDGELLPPSVVPAGADAPPATVVHSVPKTWRLIATLNDRDKDLLFDMSEALMRRFAVIEIPIPIDDQIWNAIIAKGQSGSATIDAALKQLAKLPHRPLGPAIILDCAGHIAERIVVAQEADEVCEDHELLSEAIDLYVRPHLSTLGESKLKEVESYLAAQVLGWSTALPAPDEQQGDSTT